MWFDLTRTVFVLGLITGACCLLIMLQIVSMRAFNSRRQRLKEKFRQKWRPVFLQLVEGRLDRASVPALSQGEMAFFLTEWNRLLDLIGGQAAERLRGLARDLKLPPYVQSHAHSKIRKLAACCIAAAGHLREQDMWPRLQALLRHRSACNAMLAARAMMQIDPQRAVPLFLPIAIERSDWPATWTDKLLLEAGARATTKPVADAVRVALTQENSEQLLKLIPLFNSVEKASAAVLLREILRAPLSDKVVSRCLQTLQDKEFVDLARHYLHYPRWHVRVQAAAAVGRLGDAQDVAPLTAMLKDKQWWVRYRAAKALGELQGMTEKKLREIRERVDDHYARDIIDYVLLERQYA